MHRNRWIVCLTLVILLFTAASASGQVKRAGSYSIAGDRYTQTSPATVSGLEHVVALDASNSASYALESNGTVWAWGDGEDGQLGNGATRDSTKPVQVRFPAGTHIVAIGEAQNNGYAVDSTGQGWAWGLGESASLCHRKSEAGPTPIRTGVAEAVAVQGGQNHVLWLLANGTVEGCGSNIDGDLGLGEETNGVVTPTPIPGLSDIVQVSAGDHSSAALTASGELFMFGSNDHGQIGVGPEFENVYTPEQVPLPGPVSEVSAGGCANNNSHTLALVDGEVYGWGADRTGQVGDGATSEKYFPVATGLHFSKIVASGQSSLGLDSTGEVWAWGSASGGALGNGTASGEVLAPVLVAAGASMISATAQNTLAG